MQRETVESRVIASIGYAATTQTLEVEFTSKKPGIPGSICQYKDVPPEVAERFIKSENIGQFFMADIRPCYRYQRIEGENGKEN